MAMGKNVRRDQLPWEVEWVRHAFEEKSRLDGTGSCVRGTEVRGKVNSHSAVLVDGGRDDVSVVLQCQWTSP
jgi:hypothetical protein